MSNSIVSDDNSKASKMIKKGCERTETKYNSVVSKLHLGIVSYGVMAIYGNSSNISKFSGKCSFFMSLFS